MKYGLRNILRIIDCWVENGLKDGLSGSQETSQEMTCFLSRQISFQTASAHMENWEGLGRERF